MEQTGDSTINNKERRTHLAAFISPSVLAVRHHLLVQSFTDPTNQRADPDSITKLFSWSRSRLTREAISPWTSLIARKLSLGPSEPCPGETSTTHDDSLFSVMLIQNKTVTAYESSVSALDHVPNLLSLNPLIPELNPSPQIVSTAQTSRRRTHTERWLRKSKLGFWLEGLDSSFGPLPLQRPKPISSNPCLNGLRPRSVTQCFLSIRRLMLGRFLILNGRRHHQREISPPLLWLVNYILKTIQEASSAEEDWKKIQVDSKKILAQPLQSATDNPSPKPTCIFEALQPLQNHLQSRVIIKSEAKSLTEAIISRKPPIIMIGIIGDILSIAKSFHDLSFRFLPRSENMFVDDFARTAVRSMTLGHNISLYFCFF